MVTEITLSETPRRQAKITVGNGDNLLTWTFDAPGISDNAWRQLLAHGFDGNNTGLNPPPEDREALDFRDRVASVIATLNSAVESLERNRTFDHPGESFISFSDRMIKEDQYAGIPASRINKYIASVSRFKRYLQSVGKEGILLSNLNADIMADFDKVMSEEGLQPSTRAFYNRTLLSIYLRGVKAGLTIDNSPFSKVATQYRQPSTRNKPRRISR